MNEIRPEIIELIDEIIALYNDMKFLKTPGHANNDPVNCAVENVQNNIDSIDEILTRYACIEPNWQMFIDKYITRKIPDADPTVIKELNIFLSDINILIMNAKQIFEKYDDNDNSNSIDAIKLQNLSKQYVDNFERKSWHVQQYISFKLKEKCDGNDVIEFIKSNIP